MYAAARFCATLYLALSFLSVFLQSNNAGICYVSNNFSHQKNLPTSIISSSTHLTPELARLLQQQPQRYVPQISRIQACSASPQQQMYRALQQQ